MLHTAYTKGYSILPFKSRERITANSKQLTYSTEYTLAHKAYCVMFRKGVFFLFLYTKTMWLVIGKDHA